jgi:hypothetical protein
MNGGTWQIDKHINISVVLVLVVQTAAIVWWAANIDARVRGIEGLLLSRQPILEQALITQNNVAHITDAIEKIIDRLEALEARNQKGAQR